GNVDRRCRGFPEPRYLRLFRRSEGAILGAEGLDLVVVARPEFTLEVGGRSRAELIGAGHDPWLAKRPLGRRRYRRRHVDAGGGLRPVAFWQGAIVGAQRQDGRGGPFADCDPFLLRGAVGEGG